MLMLMFSPIRSQVVHHDTGFQDAQSREEKVRKGCFPPCRDTIWKLHTFLLLY